jgi:hypothetical protein
MHSSSRARTGRDKRARCGFGSRRIVDARCAVDARCSVDARCAVDAGYVVVDAVDARCAVGAGRIVDAGFAVGAGRSVGPLSAGWFLLAQPTS